MSDKTDSDRPESAKPEKDDKKTETKSNGALRTFAAFSQIGFTMAASVLIGVLVGKYLDELFGSSPWLLIIGSLLGVIAALKSLFAISNDKQ